MFTCIGGCGSSNESADGSDNSSSGKDISSMVTFPTNEVDALQDVVKQWGEENNVKVDLKMMAVSLML